MGMLAGKIALVTGGGSGMGREAVLAMTREGARVAVVDLNRESAEETEAMVTALGGQAIAIEADISLEDHVRRSIEVTVKTFGALDCAFNNAGIAKLGRSIEEVSSRAFDSVIRVNLTGTWLCMKYELIQMRAQPERHGCAIVNNASAMGLVGAAGAGPYAASKHGVIGLTRSAALDHARSGIRINAVCPGLVLTPMAEPVVHTYTPERLAAEQPIGRWLKPEEIAQAVTWLCSDHASAVTGVALALDGGWTAG